MESLPSELISFISALRPLMRAEVFDSFCFLLMGLLVGEAKQGTVRASVFAPAQYQPQRLSDLFCRHRLSHQAFMATLARLALATLYPQGWPQRLFWVADATNTEKPYAERSSGVHWFHRYPRAWPDGRKNSRGIATCSPRICTGTARSGCGSASSLAHYSMSRGAACRN